MKRRSKMSSSHMISVLLLGLCTLCLALSAHSQTTRFEVWTPYHPGPPVFSSGRIYTTLSQGTGAMLSYVSSQQPWGAYFEPWYLPSWSGEFNIAYRVRPYLPDGYYHLSYIDVRTPAPTPATGCQQIANLFGATVTSVILEPRAGIYGGGLGRWRCNLYIAVPPWGGPPHSFGEYLLPFCASPFIPFLNDDPNGEYICGGGWAGYVYSTDYSPERPDECTEGNPIVPSSAQKVEYETDYDNGQLLRFTRSYGSQRIGIGPSAALTHSFNPHMPGWSGAGSNRRADGTVLRMYASTSGNQWYSESADTPYTITSSGSYPNLTFHIVSFSEPMSEQYDGAGRLAWRSYAHGLVHQLTYANGTGGFLPGGPACVLPVGVTPPAQVAPVAALQCVTDSFGRQLNFFVDSKGRVTDLIDPAGQVIRYAYDEASSYVAPGLQPSNNLTSVQFPDGYVRRYHYNEPAYTAGANLARSRTGVSELIPPATVYTRFATFGYDAQGRAVSTERAGGAMRHTLTYTPASNQVAVTDPLGTVRTHTHSPLLNVPRRVSTQQPAGSGSSACSDARTYDTQANVTSRVEFNGNKICYAYNTARRLETKRVEGLSATADCSTALTNPPTGARVISTEWHPYWRLKTRIAEPKLITTIAHNDNGATCAPPGALVDNRRIAVVCSRSEQPTTDESGALAFSAVTTGSARTSSYTYTTYGRVLTATDPNNRTTTYAYHPDNDSNLGRRGNVASVTNAANHVIVITDYNAHGKPTRLVDPNGVVTTLGYDSRLQLTGYTRGSEATVFRFDPRGLLQEVTLPDGAKLTYAYDTAHRPTTIVDQKGNRIEYGLDAMGNRTTEKIKDSAGVLAKNVARVIDALNRIRQVTGAVQ